MEGDKKYLFNKLKRKTVFGIKLPAIEPLNENSVKTIVDVDSNFYSMVKNRPIRQNTSLRAYKQSIRDITIKKVTKGFIEDEILRITREMTHEKEVYDETIKRFVDTKKSFDKFLAHDNDETIEKMKKSDLLAKEVQIQTDEHKQACFELATIKSNLQYTNETIMILISLGNFLHKASPFLWQESNKVTIDKENENIFTVNNDIYQPTDDAVIANKISNLPPPRLYFETPEQLIEVFDAMEKQNLNFLLATEELRSQKIKTLDALDELKILLQENIDTVNEKIKEIEQIILRKEFRESELETIFFELLGQKMKEFIVSESILKMYNDIEFTYEHVIEVNDIKLSIIDMCRALETEYNNLIRELSVFDPRVLKKIEKEIYHKGDRDIKRAIEANKLLKDVDKLYRRLNSSFEPSKKPLTN